MTSKQLKELLPDTDTPVVIYNNGGGYEWYGIEELPPEAIIVKEKMVYILFGENDEYEMGHLEKDYQKFLETGKITNYH